MPYQGFADGLYLLKQRSQAKGVDHYGILDVGNRIAHPEVNWRHPPVVIHQTPPRLRLDWLQNTGQWQALGRIDDEGGALARIQQAFQNPKYDLFGHNCEHFARFVVNGKPESTQLQAAVALTGLAVLTWVAFRSEKAG